MGKAATIYAVNGTEVLLPCTFSSCFGFHNLAFSWSYNSSDAFRIVSSKGGAEGTGQGRPPPALSLRLWALGDWPPVRVPILCFSWCSL